MTLSYYPFLLPELDFHGVAVSGWTERRFADPEATLCTPLSLRLLPGPLVICAGLWGSIRPGYAFLRDVPGVRPEGGA